MMCSSVRPSVQIQFHAAPNRRCRIAPHRTRLFSEQREYLGVSIYCSTIRESLRRTASEGSTPSPRATRSDLWYISTIPIPPAAGPRTHTRAAQPPPACHRIKDSVAVCLSVRPSVCLSRLDLWLRRIVDAEKGHWRGYHNCW